MRITFPTTAEALEEAMVASSCRPLDKDQRAILRDCVEIFNVNYHLGVDGLEPCDLGRSVAEFYAGLGPAADDLLTPSVRRFLSAAVYWSREAYRQGRAESSFWWRGCATS